MGAKVSTAYMPPEIIYLRDGKMPMVRVLCEVGSLEKSGIEPLEAIATVDVWSYGVLVFYILTGSNLHRDTDAVSPSQTILYFSAKRVIVNLIFP